MADNPSEQARELVINIVRLCNQANEGDATWGDKAIELITVHVEQKVREAVGILQYRFLGGGLHMSDFDDAIRATLVKP